MPERNGNWRRGVKGMPDKLSREPLTSPGQRQPGMPICAHPGWPSIADPRFQLPARLSCRSVQARMARGSMPVPRLGISLEAIGGWTRTNAPRLYRLSSADHPRLPLCHASPWGAM